MTTAIGNTFTPPPAFNTAGLAAPFGDQYSAKRHGESVQVDAGLRTRTATKRVADATAIVSMRDAIGILPVDGESVHLWIGGHHSMGHVLPAVLELAGCPAATVDIATLTFSKDNVRQWADMIDAREIASLRIITSVYFRHTNADIFELSQSMLIPRGVEIHTLRCHAKLLCVRLEDGRTITAEGSANTRSAKTIEQVTLFGSPEVYRFHTDQMTTAARCGTDGSGRIRPEASDVPRT